MYDLMMADFFLLATSFRLFGSVLVCLMADLVMADFFRFATFFNCLLPH